MSIEKMHSLSYMHRDIMLSNIIMNERGILKLVDFGCKKYNLRILHINSRKIRCILWNFTRDGP